MTWEFIWSTGLIVTDWIQPMTGMGLGGYQNWSLDENTSCQPPTHGCSLLSSQHKKITQNSTGSKLADDFYHISHKF